MSNHTLGQLDIVQYAIFCEKNYKKNGWVTPCLQSNYAVKMKVLLRLEKKLLKMAAKRNANGLTNKDYYLFQKVTA